MSFRATTTVAGTTKVTTLPKIPLRYGPIISTPPNVEPASPRAEAMIKTVETIRNSFVSLPVTFKKPTTNPSTTSNEANVGVRFPNETTPKTIAMITPMMKA